MLTPHVCTTSSIRIMANGNLYFYGIYQVGYLNFVGENIRLGVFVFLFFF